MNKESVKRIINYLDSKNESTPTDNLKDLFEDSETSGRLLNISLIDYPEIKEATVGIGNIPLGIYRQGKNDKRKSFFSLTNLEQAQEHGREFLQLYENLVLNSNIYASRRNIKEKLLANFTNLKELLLITLTFNTTTKTLTYIRAPWSTKRCLDKSCKNKHAFATVTSKTASKLTGKKGVQALFYEFTEKINRNWKPTNWKWVAFFEPHKCRTPRHEKKCSGETKDCQRIWHIHLLTTPFFPIWADHKRCGTKLNKPGCWDCNFILSHMWSYGLLNVRPVYSLKEGKKKVKTQERLTTYLMKYLTKCLRMRQQRPQLAEKMGLIKGSSIHKFFRKTFIYPNGIKQVSGFIKKPIKKSISLINLDKSYRGECEKKLTKYLTTNSAKLKTKDNASSLAKEQLKTKINSKSLIDWIEKLLANSSNNKVTTNYYWKRCEHSETEPKCEVSKDKHQAPLIRWEFTFRGSVYSIWKNTLLPELYSFPQDAFIPFKDFNPTDEDFINFDNLSQHRSNYEICDLSKDIFGCFQANNPVPESLWKKEILKNHKKELYNYGYLARIKKQLTSSYTYTGLSAAKAMARYADY